MTILVEEKSLQLALVKAAGKLGITQDDLAYKVVGTSKGLFGVFGKKVSIEAWRKGPVQQQKRGKGSRYGEDDAQQRRQRPPREPREARDPRESRLPREPREQREPRQQRESREPREAREPRTPREPSTLSPGEVTKLEGELREFCSTLFNHIAGEDVKVQSSVADERLILDIDNSYVAGLLAKNVKLAEAVEHIVRKKPRHLKQELPFRIFIDSQGIRRKREVELIDMAHDLSEKVHQNKRPIVLNYRSSYDRKIIHMALDKDARVYTKSIGTGNNRKLMILPAKDQDAQE